MVLVANQVPEVMEIQEAKNRREVQVQETFHNKEVILKEAMEIQEDTAEVRLNKLV